jgi:hypothetical protein
MRIWKNISLIDILWLKIFYKKKILMLPLAKGSRSLINKISKWQNNLRSKIGQSINKINVSFIKKKLIINILYI